MKALVAGLIGGAFVVFGLVCVWSGLTLPSFVSGFAAGIWIILGLEASR